MLVIPALDLQAEFSRSYATGIANRILDWEQAGFNRVHLRVAQADRELDPRLVEEVLRDVHIPVQVAGRFEASDDIDAALAAGAAFVVLGNRAMDEPEWLASAVSRFPSQVLLSTPARERRARTRGAVRTLPLDLRDIASEVGSLPLAGMIVHFEASAPIDHPELALLEDVCEDVEFPIQFAGGAPALGTLRDLEFRGVAAAIMSAAHLSAEFDEQMLARDFVD